MLNENDVRYLLVDEVWDDNYFDFELLTKSDEIMQEVDKLRGGGSYAKWIKESGYNENEKNKIKFLEGVLYLFSVAKPVALEVLKETNSKYKTKKQVEKALNNRKFDLKVQAEKAKGEASKKKVVTFEDICLPLEEYFKITIPYDITVIKFIAWENRLKDIYNKKALKSA